MTVRKNTKARYREIEAETSRPRSVRAEETYCYADCRGLTFPHYIGEHTSEHEAAQRLRARLAGGAA